jgi:hypothetical protein
VAEFHLPPRSREATPSSGKVSSDIAAHNAKEGAKGGKKRLKQHPQRATTMADYDDDNAGKASSSGMGCVRTAAHSDKCQAWPPIDHFRRLLEEACQNHAYPVGHELKDRDMMKSFMILGSLTWGMELDEDPGRSNTMPFPGEDTVMMDAPAREASCV